MWLSEVCICYNITFMYWYCILQFGTRPHERVHNMLKMSSHHPTLYNMWRGPVWSTLQFFHPDLAKAYFSSGGKYFCILLVYQ